LFGIRHHQWHPFAEDLPGNASIGGKTDLPQSALAADVSIVTDFEVELATFFIEEDDGRIFGVEERHHSLDGEVEQILDVVDRPQCLADLVERQEFSDMAFQWCIGW
jgi:hypothetical protein